MPDQIVITEKTSQAKDVRAAVGSRYGDILPAEGHLFDLFEPEDVVPAWKRWSPILLRPEGLYGTRPAEGGNKAAKLKAIREALRTAKRVWLATDCDREGQLIGQEILEHYKYRGQVMRVLFTAQDAQTIRDAFGRAKPNAEYARLYAAAVVRRQADQIYNLSLTRTATVILGRGSRAVIGVGRVKTPTLAIVCKRELEIRNFVPVAYFEVVATAKVAAGQFQMGTPRRTGLSGVSLPRRLPKRLRASKAHLQCASRISGKDLQSCTICLRYRNYAARDSAGRPPRRSKSRERRK
jgi:DNA topoisomerase-3